MSRFRLLSSLGPVNQVSVPSICHFELLHAVDVHDPQVLQFHRKYDTPCAHSADWSQVFWKIIQLSSKVILTFHLWKDRKGIRRDVTKIQNRMIWGCLYPQKQVHTDLAEGSIIYIYIYIYTVIYCEIAPFRQAECRGMFAMRRMHAGGSWKFSCFIKLLLACWGHALAFCCLQPS